MAIRYTFSIKDALKKRMAEFLTVDTGGVLRNAPTSKQRRYQNIEIAEDFKKIDQNRKQERLNNIKRRQALLEKKMASEAKLLTPAETSLIQEELQDIKQLMEDGEITALTAAIDASEAEYILIEGFQKLTVLNHIKYLHYLHSHNPGSSLHPETIRAIENIHYCINHNLPVNRIALYEVMPDYFVREIGELEESIQQLIAEKQILVEDESTASSIRFFDRVRLQEHYLPGPELLKEEIQETFENVFQECEEILARHGEYLRRVHEGKTPFRSLQHMIYVMVSNLPINYLPEEHALRQDIFRVMALKQQWETYKQQRSKEIFDIMFNYVDPPPYIANHPVLRDRWEKLMANYTNPVSMDPILPEGDMAEATLAANLREQLNARVREKYDPAFVEAMNGDRSLINKQQLELEFYTLSTDIFEKLNQLEHKSEEEIFRKLPAARANKFLIQQRKKPLLRLDHLTRMLFLNNKDSRKYTLEFFSEWSGIEPQLLREALASCSYLRVPQQAQKQNAKDVQYHILRFKM